jgi:type VI protein secretion system component Hcp
VTRFADRQRLAKGSRRGTAAQRSDAAAGLADLHGAIGNRALANVLQRWWWFRPPAPAKPTMTCTLEGGAFKEKKTFSALSFSWGIPGPGLSGQAGGKELPAKPKPQTTEFFVAKHLDELSQLLYLAAASGEPIAKATVVHTDGTKSIVYEFTALTVSSISGGGAGLEGVPVDTIGFTFETVTVKSS